ncbi:LOW QUALITY PROTEIN: C-X-C motif chemokine 11 [Ctenodactylus gundi]
MNLEGTAIVLAAMFCATIAQSFPMFKGHCLCTGPGEKTVNVADTEKASLMYLSNRYDKIEVTITLKAHKGQRCLNSKSKQASLIIKLLERIFQNNEMYEVLADLKT